MNCWVVCFDIEDDRIRRNVGKSLLRYGKRVQRSVFEILVRNHVEFDTLRISLEEMIGESGELRLYPLCRDCRTKSLHQDGTAAVSFPIVHIY